MDYKSCVNASVHASIFKKYWKDKPELNRTITFTVEVIWFN